MGTTSWGSMSHRLRCPPYLPRHHVEAVMMTEPGNSPRPAHGIANRAEHSIWSLPEGAFHKPAAEQIGDSFAPLSEVHVTLGDSQAIVVAVGGNDAGSCARSYYMANRGPGRRAWSGHVSMPVSPRPAARSWPAPPPARTLRGPCPPLQNSLLRVAPWSGSPGSGPRPSAAAAPAVGPQGASARSDPVGLPQPVCWIGPAPRGG